VRLLLLAATLLLAACGPVSAPPDRVQQDPVKERWYGEASRELAAIDREAQQFFQQGKGDQAAALIEKGEAISNRLLAVQKPTLEAYEAASDLDQLYGEMLLSNRNYGWARLLFQKNVARWKLWKPQTPETGRRLKLAQDAIAECDRRMTQ
jgi:hypothetical protein